MQMDYIKVQKGVRQDETEMNSGLQRTEIAETSECFNKHMLMRGEAREEFAARYATLLCSFVGNNPTREDEKLFRVVRVQAVHIFYILVALRMAKFERNG